MAVVVLLNRGGVLLQGVLARRRGSAGVCRGFEADPCLEHLTMELMRCAFESFCFIVAVVLLLSDDIVEV